jgi:hypothetical protein
VLTIKSRGHIVVAGCRVRAISDFEPDKDGVPRLRLAKGEILEVLADDDGSGWLQVGAVCFMCLLLSLFALVSQRQGRRRICAQQLCYFGAQMKVTRA